MGGGAEGTHIYLCVIGPDGCTVKPAPQEVNRITPEKYVHVPNEVLEVTAVGPETKEKKKSCIITGESDLTGEK